MMKTINIQKVTQLELCKTIMKEYKLSDFTITMTSDSYVAYTDARLDDQRFKKIIAYRSCEEGTDIDLLLSCLATECLIPHGEYLVVKSYNR